MLILCAHLENEQIRWSTDNQNVVRIVIHGSRTLALQQEALAIFGICVKNKIRLEQSGFSEWIIDHFGLG